MFPRALSPELRIMDHAHVHAVPDYTGATKEERVQRIDQMIAICREHGYGYVFAGYGFMAEDAEFVRRLEEAGIGFIGPCSHTQMAAGAKDEAKRTAIENQVSVTPGVNDATTRTILRLHPTAPRCRSSPRRTASTVPALGDEKVPLADAVEQPARRVLPRSRSTSTRSTSSPRRCGRKRRSCSPSSPGGASA